MFCYFNFANTIEEVAICLMIHHPPCCCFVRHYDPPPTLLLFRAPLWSTTHLAAVSCATMIHHPPCCCFVRHYDDQLQWTQTLPPIIKERLHLMLTWCADWWLLLSVRRHARCWLLVVTQDLLGPCRRGVTTRQAPKLSTPLFRHWLRPWNVMTCHYNTSV